MPKQFIMRGAMSSTSRGYGLKGCIASVILTYSLSATRPTLIQADHNGDYFYIVTNRDNAKNFKLVRTKISAPSAVNWSDVIPYDKAMKIDGIDCFRDFIAISGRKGKHC